MLLSCVSHADKVPVVQVVSRAWSVSISSKYPLPLLSFEGTTGGLAQHSIPHSAYSISILVLSRSEGHSKRLLIESAYARAELIMSITRQQVPS